MDKPIKPINICEDLRAGFCLRVIKIMREFMEECYTRYILKEFVHAFRTSVIDRKNNHGRDGLRFDGFVLKLEYDAGSAVIPAVSTEDTGEILDYWENYNRHHVEEKLKAWFQVNGFRSFTFEEFQHIFVDLLNDPEIGVVFVNTYFDQTEITEKMVKGSERFRRIKLNAPASEDIMWRPQLSMIPDILTEDQWRALGLSECRHDYQAIRRALLRFVIRLDRQVEKQAPDFRAANVGFILQSFIASIQSETAELNFGDLCVSGEQWGVFLDAYGGQRLMEIVCEDPVLKDAVSAFIDAHSEYTDGMVALWDRLRSDEYPGRDHILETVQMFSDRFSELVFQK